MTWSFKWTCSSSETRMQSSRMKFQKSFILTLEHQKMDQVLPLKKSSQFEGKSEDITGCGNSLSPLSGESQLPLGHLHSTETVSGLTLVLLYSCTLHIFLLLKFCQWQSHNLALTGFQVLTSTSNFSCFRAFWVEQGARLVHNCCPGAWAALGHGQQL